MNDNKYQDFLEKLQNVDESERDWLVMEFSLQNLSENLRQAVTAAAIPHWFDHDFLNAILKFPLKDSDFETLTNLSFVEIFPERGFNIHERSRNLLLEHSWKYDKVGYRKLSKHAAAYCKKQDQTVAHWRVETIYHGLLANELISFINFLKQGHDWYSTYQFDMLESLTRIILEPKNTYKINGVAIFLLELWQVKLDIIYGHYSSAKYFLEKKLQSCDFYFSTTFLKLLGDVHCFLNEYHEAMECYQKVLASSQIMPILGLTLSRADCIRSIGNVHLYLAEYKQAKDHYEKALRVSSPFKLFKDYLQHEAHCIGSLGDVYFSLAEYERAKDHYEKVLSFYQKSKNALVEANCTRRLGKLYAAQQQTELAITTLEHAAQLYEKISTKYGEAACFDDIATIYQHQKQFEFALKNLNYAIEIFPNEAWLYQNRAKLYMRLDNYKKAENDVKKAEIINTKPIYTLLRRAELVLWQQQTLQAVEFSQQALDKRPADGNFRAMFALTLLADGQTEKANDEMQQALTSIYQPCDFDELLENLDKLIRIYGERPKFETMRELITSSPRYKASREIKFANMI